MTTAFDPTWFRAYYRRPYLDSVASIHTPERSESEVEQMLAWTGLKPPARVADLGCGTGRHACILARRGFTVTGIDQSPDFVDRARRACEADVRFVVGDVRDSLDGPHDLLLSLSHSFGFFEDRENREALGSWATHLTPGGKLVLDVWNRERIEARFQPERRWRAARGLVVDERRRLDRSGGRLRVDYDYEYAHGDTRRARAWFRLYSRGELEEMLADCGLTIRSVWGSLAGEPWSVESSSTAIVAERAQAPE